jgi:hypothetical protein
VRAKPSAQSSPTSPNEAPGNDEKPKNVIVKYKKSSRIGIKNNTLNKQLVEHLKQLQQLLDMRHLLPPFRLRERAGPPPPGPSTGLCGTLRGTSRERQRMRAAGRRDGTVLRGSMSYALALRPGGSYSRAACSFDAELKAQTVAIEAESDECVVVLFDATSPVDAAMSFARAHDRCDAELAALTEAWEEHNIAYVHAKAHAGVTVN